MCSHILTYIPGLKTEVFASSVFSSEEALISASVLAHRGGQKTSRQQQDVTLSVRGWEGGEG